MPNQTIERPLSIAERELLERMLQDSASTMKRWKMACENALVLWAVFMLAMLIAGYCLVSALRALFHLELGWHSPAVLWVAGVGTLLCTMAAVNSGMSGFRNWPDQRPLIQADIKNGLALQEHYRFDACMRFQEPEHGGLIYFLRTTEGKVLALFDGESQDLGVQDEDPFKSSFAPRHELAMVRAPLTRYVLSQQFSGELMPLEAAHELNLGPEDWPESEEYCDIPWSELKKRLSGPAS